MKKLYLITFIILFSCKLFSEININFINGYTQSKVEDYSSFQTPISIAAFTLEENIVNKLAFFGNLGFAQYHNYTDRNYVSALGGLGYSAYLDNQKSASISSYLSSNIRKSVVIDDFSDSYQFNTGIQITKSLRPGSVFYLKSDLRYKNFSQLPELNYIDNVLKMTFINSFETKTSLKLTTALNTKVYKSLFDIDDITLAEQTPFNNAANQFEYEISVAQNIFEKTGLTFIYSANMALNNYETSLDYIGFDFAGDSEFFDDPFSFTYSQYNIRLKQFLPSDFSFTAQYSLAVKNYNYEFIMEDESYLERRDEYSALELSLTKDINFNDFFIRKMKIKLDYEMYKNSSNINFLSFEGSYFLLGCEFNF